MLDQTDTRASRDGSAAAAGAILTGQHDGLAHQAQGSIPASVASAPPAAPQPETAPASMPEMHAPATRVSDAPADFSPEALLSLDATPDLAAAPDRVLSVAMPREHSSPVFSTEVVDLQADVAGPAPYQAEAPSSSATDGSAEAPGDGLAAFRMNLFQARLNLADMRDKLSTMESVAKTARHALELPGMIDKQVL